MAVIKLNDTTLAVMVVVKVSRYNPCYNGRGRRNLRLSQVHQVTLAVMAVVKLRPRNLKTTPNNRVTPCRSVRAFH